MKEAGILAVHRIGDCYARNFLAEAIYSGHRLGREIDSENPSRPLPCIREGRLQNANEEDYVLGSGTLAYEGCRTVAVPTQPEGDRVQGRCSPNTASYASLISTWDSSPISAR